MRPIDLTKPFSPIKGEKDDTCSPAADCLHSAGIECNSESCKSFSSAMKILCLDKSLIIYATSCIIWENGLYSSQVKGKVSRNCSAQKIEETSKPSFRS